MNQAKWFLPPIVIFVSSIVAVGLSLILYIHWYLEVSTGLKRVIERAGLDPDQILAPQTWVVILVLSILVGIILMGIFIIFVYNQKSIQLYRLQRNFISIKVSSGQAKNPAVSTPAHISPGGCPASRGGRNDTLPEKRLASSDNASRILGIDIGSILVVGGEAFGLIGFDGNGRYRSFRTNTSCAAGTGSFLDQRARRLTLVGPEELSERAYSNKGVLPKIASRCAVFAKTDLVHAQQEGYSLEQICDGLCYGLAKNIVDTLSMDREASAPILFTGGVSRNRAVVRHIESITGKEVVVDETGM
ncbi:MAG: BadF/BadG/BcrA/BcrD ATPase family protein [Thermodesulfobacteriota bacterium]